MSAVFHVIDREEWERSAHFDYYYRQVKARYNISSDVDITALLDFRGEHGLKFFPVMLYAIMRAVNRNREFRMGFDEEGRLGYGTKWFPPIPCFIRRTIPLQMYGANTTADSERSIGR